MTGAPSMLNRTQQRAIRRQGGTSMKAYKPLFSEHSYLTFDPYAGDRDVDVRARSPRIVKTKTAHEYIFGETHKIQRGQLARYEKAIVDGEWWSGYVCLECLDKWFIEMQEKPEPRAASQLMKRMNV